jgi:hypothetical protein
MLLNISYEEARHIELPIGRTGNTLAPPGPHKADQWVLAVEALATTPGFRVEHHETASDRLQAGSRYLLLIPGPEPFGHAVAVDEDGYVFDPDPQKEEWSGTKYWSKRIETFNKIAGASVDVGVVLEFAEPLSPSTLQHVVQLCRDLNISESEILRLRLAEPEEILSFTKRCS